MITKSAIVEAYESDLNLQPGKGEDFYEDGESRLICVCRIGSPYFMGGYKEDCLNALVEKWDGKNYDSLPSVNESVQ